MNASTILDELNDIIYISSVEDNELLYCNKNAKIFFSINSGDCTKHYDNTVDTNTDRYLHNISVLNKASVREYIHPNTNDRYLMHDKLIVFNERRVRLTTAFKEQAFNVSYTELEKQLETERLLVKCVKLLIESNDFDSSVKQVLAYIGNYYQAETVSLFSENSDKSSFKSIYQWSKSELPDSGLKQIDTVNYPEDWSRIFAQLPKVEITSIEELFKNKNPLYKYFENRGVTSLVSVPLIMNGKLLGFIIISNPANKNADTKLIEELSFFIIKEQQNKELRERLEKASYYDSSTGVLNRNKYIENFDALTKQSISSIGVVFSDIDNLKTLNDTFGHDYGDRVITKTSDILKNHFRSQDIYRIGGDEFVVICKDIPFDLFTKKVTALKEALKNEAFGLSIGSAWSQDKNELKDLIKKADNLMYSYKSLEKTM